MMIVRLGEHATKYNQEDQESPRLPQTLSFHTKTHPLAASCPDLNSTDRGHDVWTCVHCEH